MIREWTGRREPWERRWMTRGKEPECRVKKLILTWLLMFFPRAFSLILQLIYYLKLNWWVLQFWPKPPLWSRRRVYSAHVFWIGNSIKTKIIFSRYCFRPGFPLTAIISAPVRICMHVLTVSLNQHSFTIRKVYSSKWNIFIPLAFILIVKC